MPTAPNVAFLNLTNGVEAFLKLYPLRITGSAMPSGVQNFELDNRGAGLRPGAILRTLNMHDTETFDIWPAGGGGHGFQAHSVHMDMGVAAMNWYTLDGNGPALMVTGELTGCSFVMQPGAGANDVDVAHVNPNGAGGANIAATLAANHPAPAFVYGSTGQRGFYSAATRSVSILGVRTGAAWSIYAQKKVRDLSGILKIRSVYRIWPDHTKL